MQHGIAQQHVEVGGSAGEGRHQDALHLHPQVGRVGVARHEHEAGDEALERVAAHEQAQPLPVAEREDAERGVVELVVGDLEQLVARIGLEDVVERLGQVPAGGRPARSTIASTLPRSSGVSATRALYAVEVSRPRKRCSPITLPRAS